jgi:hypothetical protein|tara:strand:- start:139 stop:402 length:264 start_codon:yes stop_codon:yes gene_type:complete
MDIAEASVTGLFKMLLILLGAFVVIRIFAQWSNNKNIYVQKKQEKDSRKRFEKEKHLKRQSLGKIRVIGKDASNQNDIQDVDFEEVE